MASPQAGTSATPRPLRFVRHSAATPANASLAQEPSASRTGLDEGTSHKSMERAPYEHGALKLVLTMSDEALWLLKRSDTVTYRPADTVSQHTRRNPLADRSLSGMYLRPSGGEVPT